jgi:DNA-binding CsgD family transcriptional regulator
MNRFEGEALVGGKSAPPAAYLALTNIDPTEWCCAVEARRKVIGRGKKADIRVSRNFACVSRLHAAVWAVGAKAFIQDLGSTSGTNINGVWIEKDREVQIAVGDRICMGDMELNVADRVPTMARVIAERGIPMDDAERTQDYAADIRDSGLLGSLTQAELEIVLWVGRGYIDDQDLAEVLFRSPHTVRTHMRNIFQKIGLHSRTELVAWLRRKSP